jgi:hypothetical protein
MFASFQSSGTTPQLTDLLNLVSEGAIWWAVSFKSLGLGEMLSGPVALLVSSARRVT